MEIKKQFDDTKEDFDDNIFNKKIKLGKVSLLNKVLTTLLLTVFFGMWFLYHALYVAEAQNAEEINFTVNKGETIEQLADRLKTENIIENKWLFKKYLVFKEMDQRVQAGNFTVLYPITLARVVSALQNPIAQNEKVITIIPGWDIRDLAKYFVSKDLIKDEKSFYDIVGKPATLYPNGAPSLNYDIEILDKKPDNVSYEGYFAPDTYRIFEDATIDDILQKLIFQQNKIITAKMREDITKSGRTLHEVLTMASIIEKEVKTPSEKAKVADIFWKRYDKGWALQADSTVHYVTGREGDVFTTSEERKINNPWNTYEVAGLPPGPISAPDIDSIKAAIYPEKNDYWYFLTTSDGEVKYSKTLDEHNANVQKYLR